MLQQKGEGRANRSGFNQVVIIQNKEEIIREGGDFIEQTGQNQFRRRRLGGLEGGQRARANRRRNGLYRRYQISQKAGEIIIPFIQR